MIFIDVLDILIILYDKNWENNSIYEIYYYRLNYVEKLKIEILLFIYKNIEVDNLDFKRIIIEFKIVLSLFLFKRNKLFK